MIAAWPCPGPAGPAEEYALAFDGEREHRVLVVPALFEEANRTRRFLASAMRRLDEAGIDSFLPDLPGCNESLQDFSGQSLHSWRAAMTSAAKHFGATHVLAVRGGALVFPDNLPGWVLEPAKGALVLRQLLRARVIAAREAGLEEDSASLLERGIADGLELAGYRCGAALIAGLDSAFPAGEGHRTIRQRDLGGTPLWLRSEPGEDASQSQALAALIAGDLTGDEEAEA